MEASSANAAALRLPSIAYLLSVLGFAATVSARALLHHLGVPHQDDWFLLDQMYRSPLVSWVFSNQNGHRLPATLLLLYLDQTWAGGRMNLLVVAAQTCAWVSVAVLAFALRGPGAADPWLRLALLSFGIFALFWSGSAFNFGWGVNHGSVWTILMLLVAVSTLARARTGKSDEARLVLLAAGAAVFATFGHGIGVLTWGALFAIWAVGRLRWWIGAVLAAGALTSIGLYSIGLFHSRSVPIGPNSFVEFLVSHPRDLILFACAFAGAPIGWALHGLGLVAADGMLHPSTVAGALLVLGTCAFGALAWRRGAALPGFALAGFGLVVFVFGGGLIVGITRLAFLGPAQAVALRFLCWSMLAWLGLAWMLGSLAASRGARIALMSALVAFSLVLLPALSETRAFNAERDQQVHDVALALVLGAPPDALLRGLARESPEVVRRVAERLSRGRRSPFDDDRFGLSGKAFAERFAVTEEPACGSAPALRVRVPGGDLATVWGRLDRDEIAPAYIVLVDSRGIVRGLGEERASPRGSEPGRRWEGVIAAFAPHERYAAYAVLRDGRSACRVGVIGPAPAAPGLRAGGPAT